MQGTWHALEPWLNWEYNKIKTAPSHRCMSNSYTACFTHYLNYILVFFIKFKLEFKLHICIFHKIASVHKIEAYFFDCCLSVWCSLAYVSKVVNIATFLFVMSFAFVACSCTTKWGCVVALEGFVLEIGFIALNWVWCMAHEGELFFCVLEAWVKHILKGDNIVT